MQPAILLFLQLLSVVITAAIVLLAFRRLSHNARGKVSGLRIEPVFLETRWRDTLAEAVPIYSRLPQSLQFALETQVLEFLRTKQFLPAEGLDYVTPALKLGVAGQACLLIIGNKEPCFSRISKIHIYPSGAANNPQAAGYAEARADGIHIHLGRNWILYGSSVSKDAFNVVIHEFAHYLDFETFFFPGIPRLRNWRHFPGWFRTMRAEVRSIKEGFDSSLATQLRLHPQGIDAVELFAHATEFFFERPQVLLDEHPKLFLQLMRYFQQDPRNYHPR